MTQKPSASTENPSVDGREQTAEAVSHALEAARGQATAWAATPAMKRAAALHDAAQALSDRAPHLIDLAVREVNKPRTEAAAELGRAVGLLRFYAQMALLPTGELLPADVSGGELGVRRRPYGVAALITPWNFPVAIPIWKAAPALAVGNCVVVKASPLSAATTQAALELVAECLPPGTLHVVYGGPEAGAALVAGADFVSFTGSNHVGAQVIADCAVRSIPVQAEMGGSNATVVLPDAPDSLIREQLVYAVAGYSGQKCTATRRVVVVGDAERVADILEEAFAALPVGDPDRDDTVIAPLINADAAARVLDAVEQSHHSGARVRWSSRPDPVSGLVPPCVIRDADAGSPARCDEIFGPVVSVVAAADDAAAIEVANEVPFGLAGSVLTADLDRGRAVRDALRVGMAKLNEPTTGVSFHAPFGGEGRSSFGPREQGRAALEAFTWQQTFSAAPRPVG